VADLKNDGNSQHIGQAIQKLLKSYHIKSKFDEANLIASWERLVGKVIAKRTKKLHIRNKVLFVQLDSPALFRKEFGADVLTDIIVM
jgi:predicted nucleic acid-binding Zn ribbon protein